MTRSLSSSLHLGPPPACSHQQKAPIVKELWFFALKGVSHELEYPSKDEQAGCVKPKGVEKDAGDKERQRDQDQRNAKGMADAVDRMLMAACVLRNPLLVAASA